MTEEREASIGELHVDERISDELDWFFNRVEPDLGIQTNFYAARARHGAPRVSPEDAVEAYGRYRRLRSWLKAMPDSDAGVLQCSYELRPWPTPLFDALGGLTGVVVRLACALDPWPLDRDAQQAMEMARAHWLVTQSLSPSNRTLGRLRHEATLRLTKAHTAYARARAKGGAK